MKKKTYKVTLAGRPWTVRFSVSVREHYGWCYHSKREIVISTRQNPEEKANTLLHEALHAIFPYHAEDFIQAAADELHDLLETVEID